MMATLRSYWPGIALAAGIAAAAYGLQMAEQWLTGQAWIEALVIAIVLGMMWRNTAGLGKVYAPGVSFVGKGVLEFAVVLLGASVDLAALFRAGPTLIAIILMAVGLALVLGRLAGQAFGLNAKLATLIAVGNAICGNSAIAAVAPVIKAKPEDVACSIAFTAVLGVVVVLTLPLLIPLLNLSQYQYGVLAGLSVYAVPQVLAATLPVSPLSGQVGTLVKLTRVLLLGPLVVFFSLRQADSSTRAKLKPAQLVPWFIVGFLALALLRSIGLVSADVAAPLSNLAKLLTVAAMAALGLSVDVRAVGKAGPRVMLAVLSALLILVVTSAVLIRVLRV
jgi:uncharacterized integral membrane protein (TIGR00698 family)